MRQGRKLAPRQFQPHDLVLRKITTTVDSNKLTPIWEGPLRITEEVGRGAYRLEHLDDLQGWLRRSPPSAKAKDLRSRPKRSFPSKRPAKSAEESLLGTKVKDLQSRPKRSLPGKRLAKLGEEVPSRCEDKDL
ncbi:hypothetical protein CR513_43568, partial [Mucuna pruriens]